MATRKKVEPVETPPASTPEGYSRVVSPAGGETLVPEELVDALLASGYSIKS